MPKKNTGERRSPDTLRVGPETHRAHLGWGTRASQSLPHLLTGLGSRMLMAQGVFVMGAGTAGVLGEVGEHRGSSFRSALLIYNC